MNWTELLKSEIEDVYRATDKLIEMVEDGALDWKPKSGDNWMTTGQLLRHIAGACGSACNGFATGDWGLPEGMTAENMPPEAMLPPASALESAESVAWAREALAADKKLALDLVEKTGEDGLANKTASAPWDPRELCLGQRFLSMVEHLASHKYQLFFYLKQQGKPVNTYILYGM